ncbi:MAG: hypothetical protein N2321_12435 [Melioribacteraceae bacterium]|nr:hypothetical protein [Melioribacteraceae bacterium]
MSFYFYELLEDFQKDIKFYSSKKRLFDKQLISLKNSDNPEKFLERISSSALFKRQIGDFRIIIEKIVIDNIAIFCLRRIFIRSDRDYINVFKPAPVEWLNRNPISEKELENIQRWIKELKEQEELATQLSKLPDEMLEWLSNKNFDVMNSIYEMYEWTESIVEPHIQNYKETITQSIFDIHENCFDNDSIQDLEHENFRKNIKLAECDNDIYILFEKYGNILILYNIYRSKPDLSGIIEVTKNYKYTFEKIDENLLKAQAKRAYPNYILADIDLWSQIQEDSVGNLALSPEQEDLLKNFKLPLFLNGQAGSGKSTMLFYLFAHIFFLHRKNKTKPLFLTYNEKLLETAKISVKSILKNHPNFSEKFEPINEYEFNDIFFPFQSYLINHILNEGHRLLFTKDKYISFNKFKKYYNNDKYDYGCRLKNKYKYSAELVWHVIRTYIKGSQLDEFTEDDFDNLAKKDKSVSKEIFTEINNTIWKNWYQKFFNEYGFWDDQDLVRFMLKDYDSYPERSAVFCDEAQDFTRNEIELILKLTSFSKYDLSNYPNIPLSFAGDPYQTINPTGFRWESLKEIFLEKFNRLSKRKNFQIFFKPLAQNYRSKPAIIKFANFIQGFRLKYLDITELEPQKPYQKISGYDPMLFVLNENISLNTLKEVAEDTIFIVPCDEGIVSEKEFVNNDDVLSKFIKIEEGNDMPIANVLSSASSKGLEFDKIIVYKFGANRPKSFEKVISGKELDDGEYIELSYFFNKLYVAITRAKDHLFIVDDKEGSDNFWNFFLDKSKLEAIIYNKDKWKFEDVTPLIWGTDKDVDYMKELDPIKVAKAFEESGMFNNNPEHLIRAARYYYTAGNNERAKNCEAYANLYSERYLEAGKIFKELNNSVEACKAFWKGKNWEELSNLYSSSNNIWKIIADYMLKKTQIKVICNSQEFLEKYDRQDITFTYVLDKIKLELKTAEMENVYKADFAKKIAQKGNKEFFDIAANFYYEEGLYEQAINCWDKNNNNQHPNYYKARLSVSNEINDKIKWMYLLNMPDDILNFINQDDLNSQSHNYIFSALISKGKFDQAIDYKNIPLIQRIEKIIKSNNGNIENQILILHYIFNDSNNYTMCIDLLKQNLNYFEECIISKDFIKTALISLNFQDIIIDFYDILNRKSNNTIIYEITNFLCKQIENYNAENLHYYIEIIDREKNNLDDVTLLKNNLKLLKSFSKIDGRKKVIRFGDKVNEQRVRRYFSNMIDYYIWKNSDWRQLKVLTIKEMTLALFNCSLELDDILSLLDHIIEYENLYSTWAKKEWIYYKERLFNELRKSNEEEITNDIKRSENSSSKIKEEIIQKCKEWGFPTPKSLSGESENQEDENSFVYESVKIYGLSDLNPEIDSNKKRITLPLKNFEIRVFINTLKIHLENNITNDIIMLDVVNKIYSGNGLHQQHNIQFDKEKNKVQIMLDDSKIDILFEEGRKD